MDGVTHWLGNNEEQSCLGSFNYSDESIVTTPIPSYVDDCCWGKYWRHLVILNGSIALVLNDMDTSTFHISILGEVGVKKSWTKLFVVEDLPCLEHFVGAGKKGKILFRREDGELLWFDLNTKMIDEFGVEAIKFDCYILFHKESILPIGGTYN
jgi:molecular chaperone HtpG